jgi:large subunit ribosomal protein L2
MPLVKVKPTSPGRRALVKVVTPELYKGHPHWPLTSKQSKTNGRNVHGRITMRHKGGGHKQHYRAVDFRRDKDGIAARVEHLEYDPNSSAHLALPCRRRAPLRDRPKGVTAGTQLMSGPKRRSSRATRCRCATSDRHRVHWSRCCPASARILRARPVPTFARWRRPCAQPAARRDPQGNRLPRHHRRSRQRRYNLESIGKAGRALARRASTVRGVAMNPIDHLHGGGKDCRGQPPVRPGACRPVDSRPAAQAHAVMIAATGVKWTSARSIKALRRSPPAGQGREGATAATSARSRPGRVPTIIRLVGRTWPCTTQATCAGVRHGEHGRPQAGECADAHPRATRGRQAHRGSRADRRGPPGALGPPRQRASPLAAPAAAPAAREE